MSMGKSAVVAPLLFSGCVGGSSTDATSSASQAVAGSIESVRLPTSFLATASARHGEASLGDRGHHHGSGGHGGVPNVDSGVNFTGSFTAPGFDSAGNAQSVWPYSMVGRDPSRNETTRIHAPVVPITVELL